MIIVLIVGLFLMRESRLELIGGLDESFADFLSRNSPRAEQPAPLTLIEINDEAIGSVSRRGQPENMQAAAICGHTSAARRDPHGMVFAKYGA